MSILQMASAWDAPVNLPEKMVLLKICDECGDCGQFRLEQDRVAKVCSLDEADLMLCMARLEAAGFLVVTARTCSSGGRLLVHGQLTLNSAALSAQKRD